MNTALILRCLVAGGVGLAVMLASGFKADSISGSTIVHFYETVNKPWWIQMQVVYVAVSILYSLVFSSLCFLNPQGDGLLTPFFTLIFGVDGGQIVSATIISSIVWITVVMGFSWFVYYYSGLVIQNSQWSIWVSTLSCLTACIMNALTGRHTAAILLLGALPILVYGVLIHRAVAALNPQSKYIKFNTGSTSS